MKVNLQVDKKQSLVILGLTLRYARLKVGYSLRDMGELANISHTLIGNIENGKTIASKETLRELFVILGIEYTDNDELIQEFSRIYNRVLTNLFSYHYERVEEDMKYLEEYEEKFINSIVVIEYSLLRFLHGVLTDTMTSYLLDNLDLLKRIMNLLSPRQQQLVYLIFGIDYYNQELYYDAYIQLNKALLIGEPQYIPLINLYLIRSQVKMFLFVDAYKTAVKTIEQFDGYLHYHRSMQTRLELAYMYALLHEYDLMNQLLDKVLLYASEYEHEEFMDMSYSIRSIMYYSTQEYDKMNYYIGLVKTDTSISVSIKMFLANLKNDQDEIRNIHQDFIRTIKPRYLKATSCFFNVLLYQYGVLTYTDIEYKDQLQSLLDFGLKCHNQELLVYAFDQMIEYYRKQRMYKQALHLSEQARAIRNYGILKD